MKNSVTTQFNLNIKVLRSKKKEKEKKDRLTFYYLIDRCLNLMSVLFSPVLDLMS